MKEFVTHSESETEELGKKLGAGLAIGDTIALFGGLGAGKTAFVRGIAAALSTSGDITSPTYTIVDEHDGRVPLIHCDMYRIKSPRELFFLGWEEFTSRAVVAVEWSENIESELPDNTIRVSIESTGENDRRFYIDGEIPWL